MRLAAFQMSARPGDVSANLALIGEAARAAAAAGAEIVVAPELATTGYGAGETLRKLAEPADGDQVSALATMAGRYGVGIVAGFAESHGRKIYDAAAFVSPTGERVIYRKCQLYSEYERSLFTPGDALPRVFTLAGVRAGLLVCYDVEFAELPRRLAIAGAELILVPTALPQGPGAAFIAEKVVPVRAFENQVVVVYANHAGGDTRFTYAGRSCIAMPDGSEATRAGVTEAALVLADYDRAAYAASRRANPYLADRRDDLV